MKKMISILAVLVLTAVCVINVSAKDKSSFAFSKGEVKVYALGKVKLHAYNTKDALADSVFLLEKNKKMIVIEQPAFTDNVKELADYIGSLKVTVKGKFLAYHMAGGALLPNVPVYATKEADEYAHNGAGKALVDNFTAAFGPSFDNSISKVTNIVAGGEVNVDGFKLNLIANSEAYDIEIPEINSIYIHMLGADTHSIVAGSAHADALIAQLKSYQAKNYQYILSSHHMPEGQAEVKVKITYLEDLKVIAKNSKDAQSFKQSVKAKYPSYYGENYLDMTAGFFFPNK